MQAKEPGKRELPNRGERGGSQKTYVQNLMAPDLKAYA